MALTGLEIFKLLPKTNCKKCGMPTCLAFAMQLAQKRVRLDACPDISEESKQKLADAAAPPMRLVKFGSDDNQVQLGQETVLFRHEEKFYSPTVLAVTVSDKLTGQDLKNRIDAIRRCIDSQRITLDVILIEMIENRSMRIGEIRKNSRSVCTASIQEHHDSRTILIIGINGERCPIRRVGHVGSVGHWYHLGRQPWQGKCAKR